MGASKATAGDKQFGRIGEFQHGLHLRHGQRPAKLLAGIPGGDRAYGGIHTARVENGLLRVERFGTDNGCYPQWMEIRNYKLRDGRLIQVEMERRKKYAGSTTVLNLRSPPFASALNRRHLNRLAEPPKRQVLPIIAKIPLAGKQLDLVIEPALLFVPQDFPITDDAVPALHDQVAFRQ